MFILFVVPALVSILFEAFTLVSAFFVASSLVSTFAVAPALASTLVVVSAFNFDENTINNKKNINKFFSFFIIHPPSILD